MAKILIVAASLFGIIGASVAYAQQRCQATQCSTYGGITTCRCLY